MEVLPVSLARQGESGLVIEWSDGTRTEYTAAQLRAACPCATCREKHGPSASKDKEEPSLSNLAGPGKSLPVLSMAEARRLEIQGMRPVGNYAYNIAFSDGHDSGIYTFDYLIEIGSKS